MKPVELPRTCAVRERDTRLVKARSSSTSALLELDQEHANVRARDLPTYQGHANARPLVGVEQLLGERAL
jgi:hypothetical protein